MLNQLILHISRNDMNKIRNSRFVSTILIFIQKKVRPIHFWQTYYRLPDVGYRSPEAQYKTRRIPDRFCVPICNNLTFPAAKTNRPAPKGSESAFGTPRAQQGLDLREPQGTSDRTRPAPRPEASGPREERLRSRSSPGALRREAQNGYREPTALPSRPAGACRTPRRPREYQA